MYDGSYYSLFPSVLQAVFCRMGQLPESVNQFPGPRRAGGAKTSLLSRKQVEAAAGLWYS